MGTLCVQKKFFEVSFADAYVQNLNLIIFTINFLFPSNFSDKFFQLLSSFHSLRIENSQNYKFLNCLRFTCKSRQAQWSHCNG